MPASLRNSTSLRKWTFLTALVGLLCVHRCYATRTCFAIEPMKRLGETRFRFTEPIEALQFSPQNGWLLIRTAGEFGVVERTTGRASNIKSARCSDVVDYAISPNDGLLAF